jgi:hypothetical protein
VGPWGQAISPNFIANSPFVDEVWQSVAVTTSLNKPTLQQSYFIQQVGAYFDQTKTPSLKSPWYIPSARSYCFGKFLLNCFLVPTSMVTDPSIGPPSDTLDFFNTPWMGF